jgi:3-methyladenine DNA glycosylase AlkD
MMATLAVHDKAVNTGVFRSYLKRVAEEAVDERHNVKKGVNWALRGIGERNRRLNAAAVKTAERLAASPLPSARWIGKDALRQWAKPAVRARLARR